MILEKNWNSDLGCGSMKGTVSHNSGTVVWCGMLHVKEYAL